MIENMLNTIHNQRRMPRYLYHLTRKKNYDSMLKDGLIKTAHDIDSSTNLDGVFMFDMINFLKRWCSIGIVVGELNAWISLAQALFMKVSVNNLDLVLLRIPTKKLLTDKLRCRQQDLSPTISIEHANNGDKAINQKHYTRKRKAIEYIYQDNIPIENITIVGEVNNGLKIEESQDLNTLKNINPLELLTKILQNKPEQKAVELAKRSSFKRVNLLGEI